MEATLQGMAPNKPVQVRRALALMWLSLAIAIAHTAITWEPLPGDPTPSFEMMLWASFVVGYAFPALVILLISRGKNWARILQLILTIVWIAVSIEFWNEDPVEPLWSQLSTLVTMALDIVALCWLFSKPAADWFKSVKGRP